MKEEVFVPIHVNGTTVQMGLTKKTTCGDVIKICVNDYRKFAVYETHTGIEKRLARSTNLLKHVRTWGINGRDYNLEVKMVTDKSKSKMASLRLAKETFKRLRALVKNTDLEENEIRADDEHHTNNLDKSSCNDYNKQYEKNIEMCKSQFVDMNIERPLQLGKMELLSRYLRDTVSRDISIARSDDNQTKDNPDYDNDSEISDPSITESDLDTAFHTNTRTNMSYNESHSGIDDKMNYCRLFEDSMDYSYSDIESAFEDISECSSLCDLNKNVTLGELVDTTVKINNGDPNARIIGDSVLESFINAGVLDDDSDEGLSSVGSDFNE